MSAALEKAALSGQVHVHRDDVDVLRGVCVLLVVLFHTLPSWAPGGFVGVDVFFVISGFLITRNIRSQLSDRVFDFEVFYAARARRILPAAYVVMAVTLLVGSLVFLSDAWLALRVSVAAGALQSANLYFWLGLEGGYFGASANANPLHHLWSLGVEEQFYLLWPLLLWSLSGLSLRRLQSLVALAAAMSFLLSEYLIQSGLESQAYYALWSRGGELLVGATVALCGFANISGWIAELCMALGGLLLFVSASAMPSESFPGLLALFPAFSGALLVAGGANSRLGALLGRLAPLRWVGVLSYSIYLYHYPIIVFASRLGLSPSVLVFLLLPPLSALSYFFVERPLRRLKWSSRKTLVLIALLPALCLLLFAAFAPQISLYAADETIGSQERKLPASQWAQQRYATGVDCQALLPHVCMDKCGANRKCHVKNIRCVKNSRETCLFGSESKSAPAALLTGDSHAAQYIPLLEEFAANSKFPFRIFNFEFNACPPLFFGEGFQMLQQRRMFPGCDVFMAHVRDRLFPKFKTILLGGMYSQYVGLFPGFHRLFKDNVMELLKLNKTVVLLGQVVSFQSFPPSRGAGGCPLLEPLISAKKNPRFRGCFDTTTILKDGNEIRPPSMNAWLKELALSTHSHAGRLVYYDMNNLICERGECSPYFKGLRAYSHAEHIAYGAGRLMGQHCLRTQGLPEAIAYAMKTAEPMRDISDVDYYSWSR